MYLRISIDFALNRISLGIFVLELNQFFEHLNDLNFDLDFT